MEKDGGCGNKTGSFTKNKESKNLRSISVPVSLRTSGINRVTTKMLYKKPKDET